MGKGFLIPFSIPTTFTTIILGDLFIGGTAPLFLELGVESGFPVAEGVNTGFMNFTLNVWTAIVLLLPLIPGVGFKWMSWTLVAASAISVPAIFVLFKGNHKRRLLDETYRREILKA